MKKKQHSRFSQRDFFKSTAAVGMAGSAGVSSSAQAAGTDNLTNVYIDPDYSQTLKWRS